MAAEEVTGGARKATKSKLFEFLVHGVVSRESWGLEGSGLAPGGGAGGALQPAGVGEGEGRRPSPQHVLGPPGAGASPRGGGGPGSLSPPPSEGTALSSCSGRGAALADVGRRAGRPRSEVQLHPRGAPSEGGPRSPCLAALGRGLPTGRCLSPAKAFSLSAKGPGSCLCHRGDPPPGCAAAAKGHGGGVWRGASRRALRNPGCTRWAIEWHPEVGLSFRLRRPGPTPRGVGPPAALPPGQEGAL